MNQSKYNNQKVEGCESWLQTMLSLNKIKEASKEEVVYYGPTVIVPKPNGAVRITHDYSGLKPFTTLFKFNQEKIESIWSWASNRKFMIKILFYKSFPRRTDCI
eukprot:GHVP01068711.1.p1 GENE.GHVP01068711.1~~GHVP01068711.1.p1  ORF type:complete len:104 (-),score=5.25 GHVP01068711.1:229-540(-)